MDPITQGALGAAVALAVMPRRSPLTLGQLAWLGAAGGMAADLDVLIRSESDPLLAILYHRHFTHSLLFIPVGGLITGTLALVVRALRRHARWVILATTIGYATHGVLDAFTTYGTNLFWPFSSYRVAIAWVSVVDPAFTLPLLLTLWLALKTRRVLFVCGGLAWFALAMALGGFQQARARSAQDAIAQTRGHAVERSAVFPTIANNVTWRSVYRVQGQYYIDKIRVPWTSAPCVSPGATVPVLGVPSDQRPVHARAYRLLRWFADDWTAAAPHDPAVIFDLRYSFEPGSAEALWGIRTHGAVDRVDWVNNRSSRGIGWSDIRALLFADGPDSVCGTALERAARGKPKAP